MTDTNIYQPSLTPDLIIDGLNRYNEEPCLLLGDKVLSYRDIREQTSCLIQALQSKGLGVGSRVAVLLPNRPEVLCNMSAMVINGCIVTSLHPMGSVNDHIYCANEAEVDALIYDPAYFSANAAAVKEQVPTVKHLLAFGACDIGEDYLALATTFQPAELVAPELSPEDISHLNFTGGTTGKPKGVMLSYRCLSYMTMMQMAEWEFPEEMRVCVTTPLSHVAGALLVPTLQRGGAFYVMESFSPDAFFDMVETHKITYTLIVPVMLYTLLDSPASQTADVSSLEVIVYGASPMNPARLKEGIERWGQIFFQLYGQSECPNVISSMRRADHDLSKPQRLSSCGRPSSLLHVALLDSEGQRVKRGEPGEICVRGPLVMSGYKNMPEVTAETMAGGWLHTGDIGKLDEDGFLYIVDRTKDMIVTGGFNVSPREVEVVLAEHDAVAQVVVVGVPDQQWGEAVKAVIVLRDGATASDELTAELRAHVKEKKGSVQSPKSIDYVDDIPLTAVGKPDKKVVRARYWQESDRGVG